MGMPTPIPKGPPPGVASGDGQAGIPIAIPIPFTAASAPTSSMLARIQAAAGNGLDPKVAEAIAALSREVIERVVWEVVPELAESIIKQAQARSA
jgi:ABC-type phosphate/phosphonate transport system permease subunit